MAYSKDEKEGRSWPWRRGNNPKPGGKNNDSSKREENDDLADIIDPEGIIELSGMEFFAYHGCLERERQEGNTFVVDLRFEVDLSESVDSDNLADTVDYSKIYKAVAEIMAEPCNLLERVAAKIAAAVYGDGKEVSMVAVRVSKKNPPVDGVCAWSRCTVTCGTTTFDEAFRYFG